MKRKISLLVFLLGMLFTAFAQKQYVVVIAMNPEAEGNIYLSGNIPTGLKDQYYYEGAIGNIISLLAKEGFTVEQMSTDNGDGGNKMRVVVLLSKSASPEQGAIETISVDDSEAVEVARYNLQGLPVNENEKGVQIIVYSNYTTKTVIVQ